MILGGYIWKSERGRCACLIFRSRQLILSIKCQKKTSACLLNLCRYSYNREMMKAIGSQKKQSKRIGIAEGECLCDPEYDFDEYNDEIARMFGVV